MTVREQLSSMLQDLVLYVQPIYNVSTPNQIFVNDYEVLMRSKSQQCFPFQIMQQLIATETGNQLLLNWELRELKKIVAIYPKCHLDLNFDLIQLQYPSTWQYLQKIKELSNQITIEITERGTNRNTDVNEFRQILQNIQRIGLPIALDDVDSGFNNLQVILENISYLYRIKFSLLKIQHEHPAVKAAFIKAWQVLANHKHLELVVEAVEDQQQVCNCIDYGCVLQQGFYWGRPRAISA